MVEEQEDGSHALLVPEGSFLKLVLNASPWVLAEALNAVFDLFAEPESNEVVVALGLMPKLEALVPKIKAALKTRRAEMGPDTVGRLKEAKLNLTRFIEYKRPQLA